jgi:hypothetical protein
VTQIAPNPAARNASGDVTLTLTVAPQVRPGQRVSLLLGGREVPANPIGTQTATPSFLVRKADPGRHWVRVRVDGIDSHLVDRTVEPPVFVSSQRVRVT